MHKPNDFADGIRTMKKLQICMLGGREEVVERVVLTPSNRQTYGLE